MRKLLFLAPLVLFASGCTDGPYRASLRGSDGVASAVHSAIKIETDLYSKGVLDDNEKKISADYLTLVTDGNMAFRKCAVAAHTAGSTLVAPYLACGDAFITQVSTVDPTVFHFKNAKAQTQFTNELKAIKAAIDGISLAIQTAKGGK